MSFQIAIDGPAGAGKSTIAKKVASKLGFIYVDTGAMYRAIGLSCVQKDINLDDEEMVSIEAENAIVSIEYINGEQAVVLNGSNVNGLIRTPEIGESASKVSVYKRVRAKLVSLQQEITQNSDVVMDGRDIASKVLPNANVKIYLDASVEIRAKRRYDELILKGEKADLSEIENDVRERDYRDMHRDISPLIKVDDAVVVDSSDMTIEQVVDAVLEEVKRKSK